jgi:septal ring factor EnvC (AmiA/AmiB activator)
MHCDAHEDMSKTSAAVGTIKWVITVGLPVACMVVSGAVLVVNSNMADLKTEIKALTASINASTVASAKFELELAQCKKDISEIQESHKPAR